jgi:tRNA nucleotidyltransferase (CCA-adding enzyme)
MGKFHINKQGVATLCRANVGKCPFDKHFDSKETAQMFIFQTNISEYGILSEFDKESQMKLLNNRLKKLFSEENVQVLNKLNNSGFEAYFVGGALRDAVLDLPINDVDITTSATPEQTMEVFSAHKVLPVGLEHGTVVVMFGEEPIEITSFRKDGEYSDSRHPDKVEFTTSLGEDVERRDFTINSLAYNPETGLVDLVGGVNDINNRIIRTVGDPDKRFQEDPLRIMRGLRFASKLGFEIEKETEESIFRNKGLLKHISAERIQKEFNGLIMGKGSKEILVKYAPVIKEFFPEIGPMVGFNQHNKKHIYDVWEHSAVVVKNSEDSIEHKLAGVFHDSGKPKTFTLDDKGVGHFFGHAEESVKIAEEALTRLKYPTKVKTKVLELIIDHDMNLSVRPYKIYKKIYELGPERFLDAIKFMRADDSGKGSKDGRKSHLDEIEKIAKEYLAGSPILSRKDLAITAKDIMDLGYKGEKIGKALDKIVLMVLSGQVNDRETQIKYLMKNGVE